MTYDKNTIGIFTPQQNQTFINNLNYSKNSLDFPSLFFLKIINYAYTSHAENMDFFQNKK